MHLCTPNVRASPAAVFPQASVTERPVALPPGNGEAPDGKISVIFHFSVGRKWPVAASSLNRVRLITRGSYDWTKRYPIRCRSAPTCPNRRECP